MVDESSRAKPANPQQPPQSDMLSKTEKPVAPFGQRTEKVFLERKVNTPGYRLEVEQGVNLSSRQQLEWEALMLTGTVLKSRLKQHAIDSSHAISPTMSAQEIAALYTTDFEPLLLQMSELFSKENPIPEDKMRQKITEIEQMIGLQTLLSDDQTRVLTTHKGQERQMEALFEMWMHDIKGKATTPHAAVQMMQMAINKAQAAGIDMENDEIFKVKMTNYRDKIYGTMVSLGNILENGMPFDTPSAQHDLYELVSENPYPKQNVPVEQLVAIIQECGQLTAGISGVNLDLSPEQLAQLAGREVVWNTEWAKRAFDNFISNIAKAYVDAAKIYQDAGATFDTERAVDLSIAIENNMLVLIIGDRGMGFSEKILQHSEDPENIPREATGWQDPNQSTTGLGVKDHAYVIKKHYGGEVTLHFSEYGGSATRIALPLASASA